MSSLTLAERLRVYASSGHSVSISNDLAATCAEALSLVDEMRAAREKVSNAIASRNAERAVLMVALERAEKSRRRHEFWACVCMVVVFHELIVGAVLEIIGALQ